MSVHHCFSTKYLTTNILHIINQFRLHMFIFNFQNLGLVTLNLIEKKAVHIIILLIFPLPQFSVSYYDQITDAFHNSTFAIICEPFLINLID